MQARRTILVICTANICRSPMGERILRRLIDRSPSAGTIEVASAGVWAFSGEPACENAQKVMAERGIDLSDHRSRPLRQTDVDRADVLLVMTHEHAQAIATGFLRADGKVHLLSQMAGYPYDIEDPYGQPVDSYRATADQLETLIAKGYPSILRALGY